MTEQGISLTIHNLDAVKANAVMEFINSYGTGATQAKPKVTKTKKTKPAPQVQAAVEDEDDLDFTDEDTLTDTPSLTRTDVVEAVTGFIKNFKDAKKGKAHIKKLLASHGSTTVTGLDVDAYVDFVNDVNELLKNLKAKKK